MKRWIGRLGLGFALGMALVGCAQEREPINRVQANALKKSFFVGEDLKSTADDPEFYKRDTVIDVGYGAAQDGLFTATYAQPVSRIRWEVTEGMLNARLSYERIKDTDGKGNAGTVNKPKATNDGQIVASYRITSHFDIRRSYNPSTGEEQNVVEENMSDRPWYEREYFRVDWGQNLVTDAYDFDTLSMMGVYGGISYEPLGYTVNDPNDPDAPHFEEGYFDVTNKAFATPQMIDLSGLGWGIDKFPACMLPGDFSGGSEPYGNCNPTELTLRSSFKQVVDHDYEPRNGVLERFDSAGAFETEYRGYERNYGMLDNQWFRFTSRYNIWERSHYYADPVAMTGEVKCATYETTEVPTNDPTADPNRDANNDGTADECEAVTAATGRGGSKCDIFTRKCTLPYAVRKTTTIPWYIGGDTDEDFFEATNWGTEEWDVALKAAAASARLVECRKAKGANCEAEFPMWTGQQDDNEEAVAISRDLNACRRANGWDNPQCNQEAKDAAARLSQQRGGDPGTLAIGDVVAMPSVIVLCHNPSIAGDHPACGPVGTTARIGDLRRNIVHNIAKPQQPSAWGIMVDADDPLTGEKVASSINIWSHVTDLAAQGLVDLVRYANGELTTAEVTDGKYVTNWSQATKLARGSSGATLSQADVTSRLATVAGMDQSAFAAKLASKTATNTAIAVQDKVKGKLQAFAVDGDIASPSAAAVNANLKMLRNTPIESELMNQPMLQMAGVTGNVPLQGQLADRASPLAMNSERIRSQMQKMKQNGLAARGACMIEEAPEASSIPGLADALKAKFPPAEGENGMQQKARHDRMFRYIRRMYHYAVLAHEMGHSVGLRHNFVSTSGPLHYRPQYWQLRTNNGATTQVCNGPSNGVDAEGNEFEPGSDCVGPRYFDPITRNEQDNIIQMFMQSTVMDYPGDVAQDMIGLGAYDFHAARTFYGDTATVYKGEDFKVGTEKGTGILQATDTFGGLAGIKYSTKVDSAQGARTETFHYSELQNKYGQINNCYDVAPQQPKTWNEEKDGKWHPVLDGRLVSVDGKTTKCRQQPVDYTSYEDLRKPTTEEYTNAFYRGGPTVDPSGRPRVPYHFATDHWADTGNVSVFRHDNGADPYEQMMFLISVSESRHIFDDYRRNRTTFSVRSAADRYYGRYNEKILGVASGMAFIANIYKGLATSGQVFGGGTTAYGATADTFVPYILASNYQDNILASSMAFDHFAKILSRPQPGPHYFKHPSFADPVLHSNDDAEDFGPPTLADGTEDIAVTIPNGVTGTALDVGFAGRPLNNAFAEDKGDFNTRYTTGAGSYYSKASVMALLSESEDRYISSSRQDFLDARFRANGLPDIFEDGYRRLLANALTGDRSMLAPHLVAKKGKPEVAASNEPGDDTQNYPAQPLAWTSWWPASGPKVCLSREGRNVCYAPGSSTDFSGETLSKNMVPVDPQVGWEVQKFLIVHALAGIRETATTSWLDMMAMYKAGPESEPSIEGRIEWADPQSGQVYYAKSIGKECLFGDPANNCVGGKLVEKGIAARIIEYANELTVAGYKLDKVNFPKTDKHAAGFNDFGRPMVARHPDNAPVIKADATLLDYYSYGVIAAGNHDFTPCEPSSDNPTCVPINVLINPETDNYAFDTTNNITFCDPALGTELFYQYDEAKKNFALDKNSQLIACDPAEGGSCKAVNCQKVSMPNQGTDCDQNVDATCTQVTLEKNHFAMALKKYKSVPEFLREAGMRMGKFGYPGQIGIY
jgi:hypothetical protein